MSRATPRRAVQAALALAFAIACGEPLSGALAQPRGAADRGTRADEVAARLAGLRSRLRPRPGGVLGLMGYNVTPDGSTNALQVDRSTQGGGDEGDPTLTLGQFGVGFTVSESFPLFLEGYFGYARYDPRAVLTGAEETRRAPFRWNNVAATVGVGYDIRLAEYLFLRPVLNASLGYAASDASLFGDFVRYRTDVDISALTDSHVNVWGLGGSLMLAYYDYRPERDIDVELRYTQIHLQTFGDTLPAARGSSIARTLGLWTRLRWPTGREAFGRPIRWVIDASASYYLGDQRNALGFAWSAKVGGGVEFDIGRYEVGALGIDLSRVRLIGHYFFGDKDVTGYSFGIGISF
jgi:hypothetical protein